MSRISPSPTITKQPQNQEFYNSFSLMGNEIFLHEWIHKERICVCNTTYNNILTDTRLLIRTEKPNCCNCCYVQNYTDVSIFLRDIAELRESIKNRYCSSLLCIKCCCCCCCHISKSIELLGVFGSQSLHLAKEDEKNLKIGIAAAIGNHKLISHS